MCVNVWMLASSFAVVPVIFAQVPLTLADAVSQALRDNPQVATAAARVAVAEGLRHQAGLGPNPRLFIQTEGIAPDPTIPHNSFSYPRDADNYIFLSHTIETGGKRQRRVEAASEGVRRGRLERELQRQQIAGKVAAAYWIAAGAARSRDLLEREAANFGRVVQYHRDRVREGASPEVDLLRVELEQGRLTAAARTSAQEAERVKIALFREMGKTEFPPVQFIDAPDSPQPAPVFSIDRALQQRPEMQLARAAIEQSHASLRLQQSNAKVDPDVQGGYKRTSGFDTFYAAVQIPLPIRNRNQGQIEAAVADIKVAESSLAATAALVRSELEAAMKDYDASQKLLTEILRPMRDRADEVFKIAEAAYREGASDILKLLDAERIKIDTQLAYTRGLFEVRQSAVAIATAQGALQGNLP